jgi:NADH:ubiquinone oxidoreductase subunit 6 (subunit J)
MLSCLRKTVAGVLLVALVLGPASSVALAQDDAGGPADRIGVTDAAPPGGLFEPILFYGVAGAVVVAALGVCIAQNIVRMAVWLFIALGSVAVLYFLLAANFIGAIQLIVYVGGTLILLVFGVMLTSRSPWVKFSPRRWELIGASLVCVALCLSLCFILGHGAWSTAVEKVPGVAIVAIGRTLLSRYLVPFEMAGVLLMIVMVGAAHLARQEK